MPLLCGVDYSMTNPSICVVPKGKFNFSFCQFQFLTDNKKYTGEFLNKQIVGYSHRPYSCQEERFANIATWALTVIGAAVLTVIEDYAMGAKGRVFHIGENTGILKHSLWKMNKRFVVEPPTVIKKFATGKGNANKDLMHESFLAETGIDMKGVFGLDSTKSPVSDIVDSYYMAKYCYHLATQIPHL